VYPKVLLGKDADENLTNFIIFKMHLLTEVAFCTKNDMDNSP
jgi:hypothetical protein